MRILLVNDDGIEADGIWALYDFLAGEHDVTVCAPDRQCSGFSHSITIAQRLRVRRHERGGARAWAVAGTPADCVLLGLGALAEGGVDLVISGINDGLNVAGDVHYSGTIGAACEACMQGVRALAVSTRGGNRDYAATLELTRRMMDRAMSDWRPGCFFSLNVPAGRPLGLRGAPLGLRSSAVRYERAEGGDEGDEYGIELMSSRLEPGSDAALVRDGYAVYTEISCDWTRRM